MNKIELAIKVANEWHAGQTDKGGYPYILHPLRVGNAVAARGCSEDAIIAAILHDIVEDTDYELVHVEANWGRRASDMVETLTHVEGEELAVYRQRILTCPDTEVLIIKDEDMGDNMLPWRQALLTPRHASFFVMKYERFQGQLRDEIARRVA